MAERFHHLNASDIFHDGVCHLLARLDCALPLDGIVFHTGGHNRKAHHESDKGQKRHTPVQNKQVHDNHNGNQHICGHFRDQVCKGRLHSLHPVNNRRFILSRGRIQNRSHWHTGKFLGNVLPQIAQRVIGCCVGNRCRKTGKQHLPKVAAQCNNTSGHIAGKILFPRQHHCDNMRHAEIGHHLAGNA